MLAIISRYASDSLEKSFDSIGGFFATTTGLWFDFVSIDLKVDLQSKEVFIGVDRIIFLTLLCKLSSDTVTMDVKKSEVQLFKVSSRS